MHGLSSGEVPQGGFCLQLFSFQRNHLNLEKLRTELEVLTRSFEELVKHRPGFEFVVENLDLKDSEKVTLRGLLDAQLHESRSVKALKLTQKQVGQAELPGLKLGGLTVYVQDLWKVPTLVRTLLDNAQKPQL